MNSAFVAGFSAVRPSVSRASLCSSKAFFGARAVRVVNTSPAAVRMAQILPVFTRAMESYKKDFPYMAEKGWGATVKAERWNVSLSDSLRFAIV